MQQTEKYKLNLIDPEDDFSPEPLNANARAVDAALTENDAKVAALTAGVGAGGHTARIAYGTYTGTGKFGTNNRSRADLDFQPWLMVIFRPDSAGTRNLLLRPAVLASDNYSRAACVEWEDRAVVWYAREDADSSAQMNNSRTDYCYIVIGISN